jgi:hypothetical protein
MVALQQVGLNLDRPSTGFLLALRLQRPADLSPVKLIVRVPHPAALEDADEFADLFIFLRRFVVGFNSIHLGRGPHQFQYQTISEEPQVFSDAPAAPSQQSLRPPSVDSGLRHLYEFSRLLDR